MTSVVKMKKSMVVNLLFETRIWSISEILFIDGDQLSPLQRKKIHTALTSEKAKERAERYVSIAEVVDPVHTAFDCGHTSLFQESSKLPIGYFI